MREVEAMTKEQLDLMLDKIVFALTASGKNYLTGTREYDELIRLARLGLESQGLCAMEVAEKARLIALGEWAEEHGIPAVKMLGAWSDRMSADHSEKLGQGLEKACAEWDNILQEPLDLRPVHAAIAALPEKK